MKASLPHHSLHGVCFLFAIAGSAYAAAPHGRLFEPSRAWLERYNPRWNLLDESDRHRLELGTSLVRGADNQYAWSIGGEIPLTSENFEFKLSTGLTWYF